MAEPADLLASWQAALRELAGITASLASAPVSVAGQLNSPLQRQAELVETILARQLEFERELVSHLLAPAGAVLELVDQTSEALESQVKAFQAVSSSFAQIAELLQQQVERLQFVRDSVRDPVSTLQAATGEMLKARPRREPDAAQ
jgi:hypothetical protein